MCGIIAVVQRRARREAPDLGALLASLDGLRGVEAASAVAAVDLELRGVAGVRALIADRTTADALDVRMAELEAEAAELESRADAGGLGLAGAELEEFNAGLVALKDAAWSIRRDRLRAAREVAELAGDSS